MPTTQPKSGNRKSIFPPLFFIVLQETTLEPTLKVRQDLGLNELLDFNEFSSTCPINFTSGNPLIRMLMAVLIKLAYVSLLRGILQALRICWIRGSSRTTPVTMLIIQYLIVKPLWLDDLPFNNPANKVQVQANPCIIISEHITIPDTLNWSFDVRCWQKTYRIIK